jgi:beta-lactamase regulating signal transducer with metallopeptidase domain
MTLWLLTWLWQGLALAFGVSAALRLFPRVNASTRHVIWWCTLAALVWLGCSVPSDPGALAATSIGGAAQQVPAASALFEIPSLPQWLMLSLATVWAVGALVALLAIGAAVRGLFRLKRSCSPVLPAMEEQLPLWQDVKSSGRLARLMICDRLPNAAVLGLRQPYIVFPSRLLDVVSLAELDQILVHEYGHVQRRDDWTRLLQATLEAALWMHPAARWIGHHLSLEREVACDDWVVSRTGAARAYAGCLARVAERSRESIASILIPALFARTPDVVKRVDRLLNARRHVTRHLSWTACAVGVCAIAAGAAHLAAIPLIAEAVSEGDLTVSLPTLPAISAISMTTQTPEVGAVVVEIAAPEANSIPAPVAPRNLVETARSRSFPSAGAAPTRLPAAQRPPVEVLTVVDSTPFQAIYPTEDSRALPKPQASLSQDTRNSWQITGMTIGAATRKASVTVAATVTKASVSFAKSF